MWIANAGDKGNQLRVVKGEGEIEVNGKRVECVCVFEYVYCAVTSNLPVIIVAVKILCYTIAMRFDVTPNVN